MSLSAQQIKHFHSRGFLVIPNPIRDEVMAELDRLQREIEPEWEKMEFPKDVNALACQMLMAGEPVLNMVEDPTLIELAKEILNVESVVISAFGMGDTASTVGGPRRQVPWHADDFGGVDQVAIRVGLDPHDDDNAPLRIIPASHKRPYDEVNEELFEIEMASGPDAVPPETFYARHPDEIEVKLDPRTMLVWTPNTWHSTGTKTSTSLRRAITWHYFAPGHGNPFQNAVLHVFDGVWQNWSDERKGLWGLPVAAPV